MKTREKVQPNVLSRFNCDEVIWNSDEGRYELMKNDPVFGNYIAGYASYDELQTAISQYEFWQDIEADYWAEIQDDIRWMNKHC